MERDQTGVWLSWDSMLHALGSLLELVVSTFRPFTHFLMDLSSASWLGLCVVVSIFFSLHVIRHGVRVGAGNRKSYSRVIEDYSRSGLLATAAFFVLLGIEWAVMPIITLLFTASINSVAGAEPGLGQFLGFLFTPTPERGAFLNDLARFYGEANTVLPLGFRFAAAILFLFVSLRLIGRSMAKLTS